MNIGVLTLQGDYREHISILNELNIESTEVRLPSDLDLIDSLIIPGGESTTIGKLIRLYKLDSAIKDFGKPILATCAGAILLAKDVVNNGQFKLDLMDIKIERNGYGRQIDSFEEDIEVKGIGKIHGIFIRAPKIISVGPNVEVLASFQDNPVLAREGKNIACTFHPELEGDTRIHELFTKY